MGLKKRISANQGLESQSRPKLGSKHQRVHSDGNQMLIGKQNAYQGYSLTGINHKRGRSGQIGQYETFGVTLEEAEDMNQHTNENEDTPEHRQLSSSHGPVPHNASIIAT